jgi:SH3-like domain-containing protein
MKSNGSGGAGSRRVRAALVAAVLAAGGAGVALAQEVGDDVWVQRENVKLRQGGGAGFPVVAEVAKGGQLKVLARNGKWLQVQAANGIQGWVLDSSLSVKKVGGGGIGALAGSDPAQMGAVHATKGLEEQAEQIAAARGQDPQLVERMIAERDAAAGEWDQFMKDGRVGIHKQ